MTHWPFSGACFRRLFLALETGASCLVSETMTHLAGKWYQRGKHMMDSDFESFENDDVTAAVLAFRLLKNPEEKAITVQLFSWFLARNWTCSVRCAGFWHQKNLTAEKYDRLTCFWYQLTGTRNRRQKLASVSSLLLLLGKTNYSVVWKDRTTCWLVRRCPQHDLRVVTDLSGEDDKTFTSDDRLDRDVFDLLRPIALAAKHNTAPTTITCLKKLGPLLYFWNNSVKHWLILIIIRTQHHEETRCEWL